MPLRQIPVGRALGRPQHSSPAYDDATRLLHYFTFPVLATAFVALTGTGTATPVQIVLSYLLLQIAWASWVSWQKIPRAEKDFPLFAVIGGMFWLAFGLPLFWSSAESWRVSGSFTSAEGVMRAQLLALLGIVSLYLGMHLGVGRRLRTWPTLNLRDSTASPKYIMAAMLVGVSLRYFHLLSGMLGGGFRQVFVILSGTLPLVAYAILLRRSLTRWVPLYERALLVLFVLGTFLFGMATGWLGTGAGIIMVTGCVLLDTRFTIPKALVLVVFAYILFLQPAKEQFRARYWGADTQTTDISRAQDWISMSRQKWEGAWSGSDPEAFRRQIYGSMTRFSLLQQSSNVLDMTPSIVPYQGWKMYEYMAYTLIPRAIWAEKPSMSEANRFYQVAYGLTTERNLDGVSIAVGMLTEGYISFGWIGAISVMVLVGVVLDCLSALLLSRDAGALMKGIGMALLPGFVAMESQMAQYFGGILQTAALSIVVILPIVEVSRRWQVRPGFRRRRVPISPRPVRIPAAIARARANALAPRSCAK
jgi:hypothetical protein